MLFSPVLLFSASHTLSQLFMVLSAKSIFNTVVSAAGTPSHSLKLQRMKEVTQYARNSFLIKKLYSVSHRKWHILLASRPRAGWIQLWVARWTFCCCSFLADTFTWNRVGRTTATNA